jgi:hypothetical protein
LRCGVCKGEAVLVDNGRDIGIYYYCRKCKLEEKEWRDMIPTLEEPPYDYKKKKKWVDSADLVDLEKAFDELNKILPTQTPPPVRYDLFRDCPACSALQGCACDTHCPLGGKTYD